jgi:hypothetical protein
VINFDRFSGGPPKIQMSSRRARTHEEASSLRYLYFRRSRLDTAIRLLEQVIRLREKRPPMIAEKSRRRVIPAA